MNFNVSDVYNRHVTTLLEQYFEYCKKYIFDGWEWIHLNISKTMCAPVLFKSDNFHFWRFIYDVIMAIWLVIVYYCPRSDCDLCGLIVVKQQSHGTQCQRNVCITYGRVKCGGHNKRQRNVHKLFYWCYTWIQSTVPVQEKLKILSKFMCN